MTTQQDFYLDKGMRGFIVNTAKREFWKVASYYEFADLVQDGYVCYYRCWNRYVGKERYNHAGEVCRFLPKVSPDKIARQHFMSLVQRAFFNHISTLASKRMGLHEQPVSSLLSEEASSETEVWDKLLPSTPEEGTLRTLLASAPAEIKQLAMLLASDGLSLLGFERKRKGRRLLRETTNEFYCRITGLDPAKYDLVGQVRAYFRS
jgi:hypothetical protein